MSICGCSIDLASCQLLTSHSLALSQGINHFVIFHDSTQGLMSYFSKGKASLAPNPEPFPSHAPNLAEEMNAIREDLHLAPSTRVLLLLSLATDDMIRQVVMHPQVWFMDCTHGVNRQKKDWFIMAVRTPAGKTFPGNLTVIPSGRRWVFSSIYQLAFVYLYGELTCSRNRLALCDADYCEYGPFEDAITTNDIFRRSALMICSFHGIWMPFKEEVFKHLPRKGDDSKQLSTVGSEWGKIT